MEEQAGHALRQIVVGSGDRPPLQFAYWPVRPDIVVDNVARYAAETGERIACIEVTGDYERILGAHFAAGDGPDVFYAQRAEASLWHARGHVAPILETNPAVGKLLRRMDQRLIDGARGADGALIGLTYYNGGPFALFVHEAFARHVDFDGLASWPGVLDQLRRFRRDRLAAYPFVPRWHRTQTGLVWSLLCHLASDGILDLGAPEAHAALQEALAFFQALVAEELVPPGCLADRGDGDAVLRWANGDHVLTFTMDYLAADARQLAGRPVNIVAPRLPGRAGTPLMPGHALLCMNRKAEGEMAARALRLLAYLGGTAADGSLRVHSRWLSECLFAVPYPELERRADLQAAMSKAFPPAVASACVERLAAARRMAQVSPPTHKAWFLEWSAYCDALIRNDLLLDRKISVEAAADALLARWAALGSRGS